MPAEHAISSTPRHDEIVDLGGKPITTGWLVTYPRILQHDLIYRFWKRVFCPRHWHLFDQVGGRTGDGRIAGYLSCDACDLQAEVEGFYAWERAK